MSPHLIEGVIDELDNANLNQVGAVPGFFKGQALEPSTIHHPPSTIRRAPGPGADYASLAAASASAAGAAGLALTVALVVALPPLRLSFSLIRAALPSRSRR